MSKKQDKAKALIKNPLSEKFGSRLPYRGVYYILGGDGGRKSFFDNAFCVPVTYSSEQITSACIRIYRELARRDLTAKVQEYAAKVGVNPTGLKINGAKTCLSSCSAKNNLSFSWRLIMMDDDVIDYVVVYELMHILEDKHSPKFWEIIEDILPEYKIRQAKLKELKDKFAKENWYI